MMHILFGRTNHELVPPPSLRTRLRCWARGGHHWYFNREFGGLWCYDCGMAVECDPPVSEKVFLTAEEFLDFLDD